MSNKKINNFKNGNKKNFGERRRVAPGQLTPPTTIYIYTHHIYYIITHKCVCVRHNLLTFTFSLYIYIEERGRQERHVYDTHQRAVMARRALSHPLLSCLYILQ